MSSVWYVVDPVLRKKLIYIALTAGFVPASASQLEIDRLYEQSLTRFKEFDVSMGNNSVDLSWIDKDLITLQQDEIDKGLRRKYSGRLLSKVKQDFDDSDLSVTNPISLGDIAKIGFKVYNRQTLLRLLIAFGYVYFSGDIASATRLVDSELRLSREYSTVLTREKVEQYKFKAYVSSLNKAELRSLLIRKNKLSRYGDVMVKSDGPVDLLIYNAIYGNGTGTLDDASRIWLGTGNKAQDLSTYAYFSDDEVRKIYPNQDFVEEKLVKIRRYRQAMSMGVTALKMANRSSEKDFFDETVYALIAVYEYYYKASLQVEYIMQGFPASDEIDILSRISKNYLDFPEFDNNPEVQVRAKFVADARSMTEIVPSEVIRGIYLKTHSDEDTIPEI